eukprot:CAMPEP_0184666630 /NCGR_PEP_ID=MMETSP0308-20130426/62791_1 /TAXON_ID=38269 /ORGANISM="Gloeochaete witrockiana, Strain SAG 46.84" /LENGTH=118 /DNA_ID=CAMNT_0027111321 /DNA_START=81 /DNA_END=438 /DNA_ORIENTATION=+
MGISYASNMHLTVHDKCNADNKERAEDSYDDADGRYGYCRGGFCGGSVGVEGLDESGGRRAGVVLEHNGDSKNFGLPVAGSRTPLPNTPRLEYHVKSVEMCHVGGPPRIKSLYSVVTL